MTSRRRKRDFLIFILGTVLGVLGNFFVEYYLALTYPQGIPRDEALGGVLVMGGFLILYLIVVWITLTKE